MAAKAGGGDPDQNLRLRYAIDDAKAISMPKENIQRAIKRGTGELDGGNLEEVLYEGYGAGGVGLNLQFVNYVFLFDRWWNPAVEDQAINRAHRIGVDGPVTVTRFLMLDTIEERIDRVLQEKRELFDIIFSGAECRRKLGLTQQELFGLFKLRCPAGPIKVAA